MNVAVVILAAGRGTRMRSDLPKALHEAAGRPLVAHVVAACRGLTERGASLWLVVSAGPEGRAVAAAVPSATPVVQTEQRGTGHALVAALARLPERGTAVVLNGDMPLVTPELVEGVVAEHHALGAAATLVSAVVAEPAGFGRVLRGPDGAFERIVEHADAGEDERRVREVNAGLYAFDLERLRRVADGLATDNAQGEAYLPDLFPLLRADGGRIAVVAAQDAATVAGVNTQVELADAAAALLRRRARALGAAGVRVEDLDGVRVEAQAEVQPGAALGTGTLVRGASRIESGSVVAASHVDSARVLSGARIAAGAWIAPGHAPPQGAEGSSAKGTGTSPRPAGV